MPTRTTPSFAPSRPHFTRALCVLLASFGLASAVNAAPPLPFQVYNSPRRIATTVFEDEHYNHAAAVAQYGDRIYVAWNGNRYNASESQAGQVIMLSTSDDNGAHWSPPVLPFVKEYRAFDDHQKKGIDAAPGNADDDHKVRYSSARQWQPSLTVFKGKLLMFWTVDRFTDGSALLMSVLEPDGKQWRTNEMHFKADGTPYFLPEIGGKAPSTDDPSALSIENASRYTRIVGASEAIPQQIRLVDVQESLLKVENARPGLVNLAGQKIVPAPMQATVFRTKDGTEVLGVSVVLHQTAVDWNIAVKVPALLTTTDGEHWQLSLVPVRTGNGGLLSDARGDIGVVSGWETTTVLDRKGEFQMVMRLNLPLKTAADGFPTGTGYRLGATTGRYEPGVGVRWEPVHAVDMDVPTSRTATARIPDQRRWVMVANHFPQGVTYEGTSTIPQYKLEKYEPWARGNLEVFFSTRGTDDYVAGLNISGNVAEPGKEVVHYPVVQSASIGGKGDDLLIAYSSHRREASCQKGQGGERACHDSIQFVRIADLPDPKRPAIYPNHFARYFAFGKAQPQDGTYNWDQHVLTLHDRGSAGIETWGARGCLNLRFRIDGEVGPNDVRPVLSFWRTADRASSLGLVARGGPAGTRLMLGDRPVNLPAGRDGWTDARVCYDFPKGRLSTAGVEYDLGPGRLSKQTYLGDPTIARREHVMPDLRIDVGATSLEVGEEE